MTITLKGTYSQSSPALTFTVTQQPAHGALSNPSAVNCTFANSTNTCTQTIKYTPASNFNGLDSFKFKASTAALDSDEADVNITVGAVNDPPVAIPQSVATDEDTPLPVTLTGTDVDSTTLTFQIVAGPSHGSLSGTAPNVTYTPAANYNGPDSFTFQINDGSASNNLSNVAQVSITVNPVNDPPVAADETYNTSENTPLSVAVASGVLKNDTDIDSVGLTAQVVAAPTHSASFTLNADGSFAYTPAANFVGTDTFTYKANDGSASNNLSNTATVTIKVGAGGTLQFNSATYSVTENAGTVTVTVTRTGSSNGAASIHYATVAGGTATGAAACAAGVDFVNTSGTLNWADGDAADKTFTVTICDDSLFEQDETVNLALSNVAGSAELGAQAAAVLTIHDDDSKGGVFGFSQPTYTVGESAGFVTITVTRTGDTTRASAVDYATDDGSDPHVFVPCDSTTGIALERCDYTAAFGTLQFAAGETSKTFVVLISDDSYAEGNEVTTLKLSNPTNGSALGSQAAAMLQIQDDVPESQGNRNDDDEQFVRQHYHDFLGREADADGLKFWTDGIKACGSDAGCREVKRINTSAAFFLSIEFQNTGFFAYRVFKAAFGDATGTFNDSQGSHQLSVPAIRLHEFLRDTREVGQGVIVTQDDWPAHLDSNKSAFALEFVQRDEFLARYPGLTSATAFVNTLDANTGGVMTDQQKSELIAELSPNPADAALRADVLRKVADNAAFMSAESNRAFVLIEYFGYLRRNPDDAPDTDHSGYQFWLQKLNQFHGNFVKAEMIKAFISSDEYRRRFGQ
ncbi:MAG: hypothetical protein DMF67_15390 [Acidobacteria bacterium]|nr:MAG: hypothetical protein DMF67_15390 [Acidobacteriota bacterium]